MADNEWTDELKQEVCEAYTAQEPTQEKWDMMFCNCA